MLAAALTFGVYVVGHFNADLKNFEAVVDSPPVVICSARALYYLLPNLAPLDMKNAVVHALPVPGGYLLLNTAYAVMYIAVLVSAADVHLHAARLQMTDRQQHCRIRVRVGR